MKWKQVPIPANTEDVLRRHEANKQAWNEGAAYYTQNLEQSLEGLRDGKSGIHPVERENLRSFGGLEKWCRRAVHLQCASGYDSLSLLLEGAHEVVGVDISDVHIENARWLTRQLNAEASWYCCDVLEVPVELDGTADLVYTGRGAVTWIQDLGPWAKVIARLMKSGGVFSFLDDHPFIWLISQEDQDLMYSGADYFGHAEESLGWSETYIGSLSTCVDEQAAKYERLWTVSQLVQSLIDAGLHIRSLGEHREEYWNGFPKLNAEVKNKIPMTLSITAVKQ